MSTIPIFRYRVVLRPPSEIYELMTCHLLPIWRNTKIQMKNVGLVYDTFIHVIFTGFHRHVNTYTVVHQQYINKLAHTQNIGGADCTPSPSSRPLHGFLFGNCIVWLVYWTIWPSSKIAGKPKNIRKEGNKIMLQSGFDPGSPCGFDTWPVEQTTWTLGHEIVKMYIVSWFLPRFTLWFRHQAPRAHDMTPQPEAPVAINIFEKKHL